jgi:WD40 repeat protein
MMTISNDGQTLIGLSSEGLLQMFRKKQNTYQKFYSSMIKSLKEQGNSVECIQYFSSGKEKVNSYLLLGCDKGIIIQYCINKKESSINRIISDQSIVNFNYSNDELLILTSDQFFFKFQFDIENSKISEAICLSKNVGYCEEILDAKFLPNSNGKKVVFTSNDNFLKIIDLKTRNINLFHGHKDFIMSIFVSDSYIVTGSKDSTVRLWKYKNDEESFYCKEKILFKGFLLVLFRSH